MKKLLIANRGEIALRIIRTTPWASSTVADVLQTPTLWALHVRQASRLCPGGSSSAPELFAR